MGRTQRARKKKRTAGGRAIADDLGVVDLLKYMKTQGFANHCHLSPALFPQTGRGVMTRKCIKEGDILLTVPCGLLIGGVEAAKESLWITRMMYQGHKLSTVQVICVFLVETKRKVKSNVRCKWGCYVKTLPVSFTHHVCSEKKKLQLLPCDVHQKAVAMRDSVFRQFQAVQDAFANSRIMEKNITWQEYQWAWCCVNTRCVYSNHRHRRDFEEAGILVSPSNNYYLVPFLDLLNHSPTASVFGLYNKHTGCYELKCDQKFRKYDQVFICYGPHSTKSLFLEYGFVTFCKNPNDVCCVFWDNVIDAYKVHTSICEKCVEKLRLLCGSLKISDGWSLTYDGVSYNLKISLLVISKILCGNSKQSCCQSVRDWLSNKKFTMFSFIHQDTTFDQRFSKFANDICRTLLESLIAKMVAEHEKCHFLRKVLVTANAEYEVASYLHEISLNLARHCQNSVKEC